jgi:NADP-dependent 3-hydroxy acid dehydrogenase YdfG
MEDLALVTGSASGIGQACVRRLNQQGIPVVGLDLAEGTSTDLLSCVQGDISEEATWNAARQKAESFGLVEVVRLVRQEIVAFEPVE